MSTPIKLPFHGIFFICLFFTANSLFLQAQNEDPEEYLSTLSSRNPKRFAYTQGSFTVNDIGAAVYEFPINAVPGAAGLSPKISLTYSSANGTGIAGEGWALSGFSAISRAPRTYAQDQMFRAIDFSREDRLSLDGQRLVNLSQEYWPDRNDVVEYRTELNTQKKVLAYEDNGLGIERFEVYTRDGLVYHYGKVRDSSYEAYVKHPVGNIILSWLLVRITDRNKNYIDFEYDTVALRTELTVQPKKITYTGHELNASLKPFAFIEFRYGAEISNPLVRYVSGVRFTSKKYLSEITCYYKPGVAEAKIFRYYKLEYNNGQNDPRKRYLKQIRECVRDYRGVASQADCMDIDFTWLKENDTLRSARKELEIFEDTLTERYKIFPGDFNADGFADLAYVDQQGDSIDFRFRYNNHEAQFGQQVIRKVFKGNNINVRILTGDFDANGTTDFSLQWMENNIWKAKILYVSKDSIKVGDNHDLAQTSNLPFKDFFIAIADFNADGLPDIVGYNYTGVDITIRIIQNLRANWALARSFSIPLAEQGPSGNTLRIPAGTPLMFSDVNGDGANDILINWTEQNGWHYKTVISQNGFSVYPGAIDFSNSMVDENNIANITSECSSVDSCEIIYRGVKLEQLAGPHVATFKGVQLADVNLDGHNDLILSGTGKDGWKVYVALSKGNGTFQRPDSSQIIGDRFEYFLPANLGEFNGDGIIDLALLRSDQNGWHRLIAYGNGKGGFTRKNKGWVTIDSNNFSYKVLVPQMGVFCFVDFFTRVRLIDPHAKQNLEMISRTGETIPVDIWNNFQALLPFLTNYIQKNNYIETPYYPTLSPNFYDGVGSRSCSAPLRIAEINFENNPKLLVNGRAYNAGPNDSLRLRNNWLHFKKYFVFDAINYWKPFIMDLDGDGLSDFLLAYPRQPEDTLSAGSNPLDGYNRIFKSINESERAGYIRKIVLDNKSEINISYNTLLRNIRDTVHFELNYPFAKFRVPMTVVDQTRSTNGLGNRLNAVKYSFSNGIISYTGRGFLGFQRLEVQNLAKGEFVIRECKLDSNFLQLGVLPLQMTSRWIKGNRYSVSWRTSIVQEQHGQPYFLMAPLSSADSVFEKGNKLITWSKSRFRYDNFSNLVSADIEYPDGMRERTETTWYEDNTANNIYFDRWLLGRTKEVRVTKTRGDEISEKRTRFEYDEETGQLTKEENNPGSTRFYTVKEFEYDERGNKTKITLYDGNRPQKKMISLFDYDPVKRYLLKKTDPLGYTERYTPHPIYGVNMETYDSDGNKSTVALRRPSENEDPFGRYRKDTRIDGTSVEAERRFCNNCGVPDAVFLEFQQSSLSSYRSVIYYDKLDRPLRIERFNHKGKLVREDYKYDEVGNVISTTLPYFTGASQSTLKFRFDEQGRKIATRYPDGTRDSTIYDGNRETYINAKGLSQTKVKDWYGRVTKSVDATGDSSLYGYDQFGNMTMITGPDGVVFKYTFNEINKKLADIHPNKRYPTSYSYTAFGELDTLRTSPNEYAAMQYDELGRLTKKSEVSSARNQTADEVTYQYIASNETSAKGKGKIKTVTVSGDDRVFGRQYEYDKFGRLIKEKYVLNQSAYADLGIHPMVFHDKLFFEYFYNEHTALMDSISYPSRIGKNHKKRMVAKYNYQNGAPVEVYFNNQSVWKLRESDAFGQPILVTQFDGMAANRLLTTSLVFDPVTNNVVTVDHRLGNTTLQKWDYVYDTLNNIRKRTSAGQEEEFLYDKLNRLAGVVYRGDTARYQYNNAGRMSSNETLANITYEAERSIARMQNGREIRYAQDEFGNRYSRRSNTSAFPDYTIRYNHFDKPRKLEYERSHGDNTIEYKYDIDEEEAISSNQGTDVATIRVGGLFQFDFFTDYDSTFLGLGPTRIRDYTAKQKFFITVGTEMIAYAEVEDNARSEKLFAVKRDVLNSVTLVVKDDGTAYKYSYDAWGRRRDEANWRQIFQANEHPSLRLREGYAGHLNIENASLINMGSRIYDPLICQFLSADAYMDFDMPTQGIYPYSYVLNNPLAYTDPTGDFKISLRPVLRAFLGAPLFGATSALFSNLPGISTFIDKNAGTIAQIEISIALTALGVPPQFVGFASGFGAGFSQTYLNGGTFGHAVESGLQSGTIGFISGAVSGAIGSAFADNLVARALANGVFQGALNEAQGGSFTQGFVVGSLSTLSDAYVSQMNGTSIDARTSRLLIVSVAGGSLSLYGGGKFANGAASAVAMDVFNMAMEESRARNSDPAKKNESRRRTSVKRNIKEEVCDLNTVAALEHYLIGGGREMNLSDACWQEMKADYKNPEKSKIEKVVINGKDYSYRVVSFYDSKFAKSIGSGTMYFDKNMRPVGFRDTYDFDCTWKDRGDTFKQKLINNAQTCTINILFHWGVPYRIKYGIGN